MSKPWEQGGARRSVEQTRERRRVLIVCEDTKSSCYYFKGFPIDAKRVEVTTIGSGRNTDSLVEMALELKRRATEPYNQVWCVLDRDSFPIDRYCRAFQLARDNSINVAWANEAFELWYVLHFAYCDAGICRDDFKDRLRPHLKYDKADDKIYAKLTAHQAVALRNAARLQRHWNELGTRNPERENPSTSVHRLVQFLNDLADLGQG